MTAEEAQKRAVKGIAKGLLKTMSKMGISTIPSYCGAQIFEILGLAPELVDRYFTGTPSRIGGIGIETLAEEMLARHARAYPGTADELLPVVGLLRLEARRRAPPVEPGDDRAAPARGARGRLRDVRAVRADGQRRQRAAPDDPRADGASGSPDDGGIPLDEVEPAAEIVKRFVTGAMSLGSLSREAHETLAIAMNRLGGRSNTGEGGEDPARYVPDANGDSRRSSIKQVASGRFGVNIDYLTNADELQIKMAQGAKPGEGGQLPGHKVDGYIASVRHDDGRRRTDLAAAAPRHLLDRGSEAADLRPALRQPGGADLGEARRRGGGRDGRGGRREGQRRSRSDLRPRRRHRGIAAVLDPASPGSRGRSGSPRRSRRSS